MPLCKIIQIMTWLHLFDKYSSHRTCVHEYNRIGGNWSIQRLWIFCIKGSPKYCSRWDSYFEWWILTYSQADDLASHSFVPISVRLLNKFTLWVLWNCVYFKWSCFCIRFIIWLCLLTYVLSAMSPRKTSLTGKILRNQRDYMSFWYFLAKKKKTKKTFGWCNCPEITNRKEKTAIQFSFKILIIFENVWCNQTKYLQKMVNNALKDNGYKYYISKKLAHFIFFSKIHHLSLTHISNPHSTV